MRARTAGALSAAVITVAATAGSTAPASAAILPVPVDCPAAVSTAEAVDGVTGTGWTVERGTTPDAFSARVLGRITDGIAPGVDLIMAELSSPALTRAGGVWAGMSGSPVYTDDGRLLGSVSYGLASSSPIAGITPAAAMQRLLSADPDDAAARARIGVPGTAARRLARTGAVSATRASQGFRSLPVPITVSGAATVPAKRLAQRLEERAGVPVRLSGAGTSAAAPDAGTITGGSNVAAAVSYGDATLAGIGTTTYTCRGRAVIFGHPLLDEGVVTYSAHPASAVYVQPDPVYGPFKVANPGAPTGTIDRDRTVGLRTQLGRLPASTLITSRLTRVETGRTRTGTTHAVYQPYASLAAAYHVLYDVDDVLGSASAGSAKLSLRVGGRRADGTWFVLTIGDAFASGSDPYLDYRIADWVYGTVGQLVDQPYEKVRLTSVALTGRVSSDAAYWRAPTFSVYRKGAWVAPTAASLTMNAGGNLWLRATLPLFQQPKVTRTATFAVRAPLSARRTTASLRLTGGEDYSYYGGRGASFDAILESLASAGRADQIRVQLVGRRGARLATRTVQLDRAVDSFGKSYRVTIR